MELNTFDRCSVRVSFISWVNGLALWSLEGLCIEQKQLKTDIECEIIFVNSFFRSIAVSFSQAIQWWLLASLVSTFMQKDVIFFLLGEIETKKAAKYCSCIKTNWCWAIWRQRIHKPKWNNCSNRASEFKWFKKRSEFWENHCWKSSCCYSIWKSSPFVS